MSTDSPLSAHPSEKKGTRNWARSAIILAIVVAALLVGPKAASWVSERVSRLISIPGVLLGTIAQAAAAVMSASYTAASVQINASSDVIAMLGEPLILPDVSAVVWAEPDPAQPAEALSFSFPVEGPKGKATALVVAVPTTSGADIVHLEVVGVGENPQRLMLVDDPAAVVVPRVPGPGSAPGGLPGAPTLPGR